MYNIIHTRYVSSIYVHKYVYIGNPSKFCLGQCTNWTNPWSGEIYIQFSSAFAPMHLGGNPFNSILCTGLDFLKQETWTMSKPMYGPYT